MQRDDRLQVRDAKKKMTIKICKTEMAVYRMWSLTGRCTDYLQGRDMLNMAILRAETLRWQPFTR